MNVLTNHLRLYVLLNRLYVSVLFVNAGDARREMVAIRGRLKLWEGLPNFKLCCLLRSLSSNLAPSSEHP